MSVSVNKKQFMDDDKATSQFNAKLTRRAFDYLKPHKRIFTICLIMLLFNSVSNVTGPFITKLAVDEGVTAKDLTALSTFCIIYLLLFAAKGVFHHYQVLNLTALGQNVTKDVRNDMFSHIQVLGLDFFQKREVGRIISRIVGDVNALNGMITSGALVLLNDIVTSIVVMFFMFNLSVSLTLITFTLIPFVAMTSILLRSKVRSANREVRQKNAAVTATVAQNVSGVKVVKSYSRERRNLLGFKRVSRDTLDSIMNSVKISSLFSNTVILITFIGIAMVIYFGGLQVRDGELTYGGFIAFMGYIGLFFTPVNSMSNFYNVVQAAMAGAERIFDILETKPNVEDKPDAVELGQIEGDVVFEDVSFSYEVDVPVLKKLSFHARPGETVAIVGPTGAGKSTIINLLPRQYDIESGRILVDGTDIRDVTLDSLRGQMGIVLQDSFLFSGTIMDNIRYGRLDATEEEVIETAKAVGAHEFIEEMPRGYHTEVREGGGRLSTGQKQLVSFARALIADPRILVLDEATSSVDPHTELIIQEGLKRLFADRTSFVVAHRLSTILEADRIMVIEDGQVAESGKHHELMASGGHYARLYEAQVAAQKQAQDLLENE